MSTPKFALMSLCTFGLYELYWCYKQWDAERRREREDLSPFWRAFFAPIWGFRLFPRIQVLTAKHGMGATWSGSGIAVAYLLLHLTWRLPDPLWLVSLLTFLPLLPIQRAVSGLNAAVAPDAPRNDTYSWQNFATILIGGAFLLLAIIGTLLPRAEAQFAIFA